MASGSCYTRDIEISLFDPCAGSGRGVATFIINNIVQPLPPSHVMRLVLANQTTLGAAAAHPSSEFQGKGSRLASPGVTPDPRAYSTRLDSTVITHTISLILELLRLQMSFHSMF